jgi:hypothetical protein
MEAQENARRMIRVVQQEQEAKEKHWLDQIADKQQRSHEATLTVADLAKRNLASEFYARLLARIVEFDSTLDNEHEVGVRLVSFGQTVVLRVEALGYHDPSLIMFFGHSEDGSPIELIQHVSQISFLLTSLKRPDPSKPKVPFGFTSQKVRDFFLVAESQGMTYSEETGRYTDREGREFDREGNPVTG